MKIQVLTMSDHPEFEMFPQNAAEVDEAVRRKYGRQLNGLPHNWRALPGVEKATGYNTTRAAVAIACQHLTDSELAAINNAAQVDWDPQRRL